MNSASNVGYVALVNVSDVQQQVPLAGARDLVHLLNPNCASAPWPSVIRQLEKKAIRIARRRPHALKVTSQENGIAILDVIRKGQSTAAAFTAITGIAVTPEPLPSTPARPQLGISWRWSRQWVSVPVSEGGGIARQMRRFKLLHSVFYHDFVKLLQGARLDSYHGYPIERQVYIMKSPWWKFWLHLELWLKRRAHP